MKMMTVVLATATLMVSYAQADDFDLEHTDLSWLEGCWEGEAFGGYARECWVSGPGHHMTGLFQFEGDEAVGFTEIMHIGNFAEGPGLRLKHLNPDMTSWEAQDEYIEFPLRGAGEGYVHFEGLQIERKNHATIRLDLKFPNEDGSFMEETIIYTRMPFQD